MYYDIFLMGMSYLCERLDFTGSSNVCGPWTQTWLPKIETKYKQK